MDDKIASLLLLCDMLDCIYIDLIKKGLGTEASATTLQDIMKKHSAAFVECYGLDNHFSFHIPEQWLECLMRWFDCWPQERKHRIVIMKARHAYNTSAFERTVMSRIWLDAYRRWTGNELDKHFHSGVLGIQQNCPALADKFGADEAAV